MDFLTSNWELIIAALCFIGMIVMGVIHFAQRPTPQQTEQIFQWLIWAVTEAEKTLGSNMGKLKLRYVYDMFLTKFDYVARIMSFEKFSGLVDKALDEMKHILESNSKVQEYVGVEIKPEEEKKEEVSSEV